MSTSRGPLSTAYLCLMTTILVWGFNWPVVKVVLRELPPLFARGLSGLGGAILLALFALWRSESLHVPQGYRVRLAISSVITVFAWMGFPTVALKWLTVAEGALVVYTMPIWATLFAWPILGTRPTLRGVIALLTAFSGVAVLLLGPGVDLGLSKIYGIALNFTAAILFALGAVTTKDAIPMQPIALTAWLVFLGSFPMVILSFFLEDLDIANTSTLAWGLVVYMAIAPMGIGYLTWFAALRTLPASLASTAILMVPLIGILSAGMFIGEPLGPREIIAVCLTLGGVTLAVWKRG
jgi:drug/metabolite transporter (DMT)-like permease